jgi:predicted aconitase
MICHETSIAIADAVALSHVKAVTPDWDPIAVGSIGEFT